MIHGGIDGYSCSVTYLQCSSNNKSVTVLRLFKKRLFVIVYHPGYVQILAQIMLKLQDICWNVQLEVLTGKVLLLVNPYTQRIERLWRI